MTTLKLSAEIESLIWASSHDEKLFWSLITKSKEAERKRLARLSFAKKLEIAEQMQRDAQLLKEAREVNNMAKKGPLYPHVPKSRRCARCGTTKDVKYRAGTGLWLCDNCFKEWHQDESPQPTIRIVPYTPKEPLPPNVKEYYIQILTPAGEIAGYLGYEEHPDYVRIDIIKVEDIYQGRGYSGALLKKLLEVAGKKPILTGSLNHTSWRLLRHGEKQGKIKITEPRPEFSRITYFQLEPVS